MAICVASFASIMLNIGASNCRTLATTPVSLVRTLASSHSLKNQPKSHTFWRFRNRKSLQRKRSTFAFEPHSAVSDVVPSIPTSSPTCYPEYHRLLPCPSENGPPRVEHLVVLVGGPVLEYISKTLGLPPMYVADLIHFGAVYYALVCPDPPPTATTEEFRIYKEATAPAVLRKRSSIKGKTIREAQKTYRITHVNEFVEAGTYLRVHVHPKRFPRCYEIDWRSRIIAVSESYVVLDKPAGTSVGGTTDNIEESCATFATRALGFAEPLKTTHHWAWRGVRLGRRRRRVWLLVPFCLMWLIWLERNRRIFLDVSHTVSWLQSRFLVVLHSWLDGSVDPDLFVFLDFLDGVIG